MKSHLVAVVVLLLGLASIATDLTGLGVALFFAAASIGMALWLHAVQAPRRPPMRLSARIAPRR